jgi:hypothetical protein
MVNVQNYFLVYKYIFVWKIVGDKGDLNKIP